MKKIVLFITLLMVSCTTYLTDKKSNYYDDYFFVRSVGADLPVWVRGNTNSDVMMLHIAGGPGDPGQAYLLFESTPALEDKYTCVYYDQRSSGFAEGNASSDSLTVVQEMIDLDAVVDVLIYKYHPKTFVLWGASWGGFLGTVYLTNSAHQNKFDAWIEVDGAHDYIGGMVQSILYVTSYASNQILSNRNVEYWQGALKWYETNHWTFQTNQLIPADFIQPHGSFVRKAEGYTRTTNKVKIPPDMIMFSPGSYLGYMFNAMNLYGWSGIEVPLVDLTPAMSNITIPVMIMWGEFDGILPVSLATNGYAALGTPVSNKQLVIIPNSGHSVSIDYPELTVDAITNFIDHL